MDQDHQVYDDDSSTEPITGPNLHALEGGGESTEAKSGHLTALPAGQTEDPDTPSARSGLKALEGGGESTDRRTGHLGLVGGDTETGGNLFSPQDPLTGGLRGFFSSKKGKRTLIGGGVVGILVGGGIGFFSLISGPLQFVHFAQLLQQFHFSSNEEFGDNRSSKILLYALAGKGAERGRLGITGNRAADKWEKTLLEKNGVRPIYNSVTRINVGLEIVDENKFFNSIDDVSGKDQAALERAMGKGVEIRTASEASFGKQKLVRGGSGEVLPNNTRVVDYRNVKTNERRLLIRTLGRMTGTSKISTAIGSRLLIKRGGVDFHPLKDIKRKAGQKIADYNTERRQAQSKEDSDGVKTESLGEGGKDQNGNPTQTDTDIQATGEANKAAQEAASKPGRAIVKQVAGGLGKGAAAIGVLCAAKSLGSDVTAYKYSNIALPMERMGMNAITRGNQVMSNKGVNLSELGAFNESFYDPETKTSWTAAKSIQSESGQPQTGVDMPPEARLSGVNDKPAFFDALDQVPFLGTACGVGSAIGNLPIIKQVSNFGSDVVTGGLNLVAKQFGTSVEKIMEGALAAIAGKSVDTMSQGADYGNLANAGAYLAANDNAITMGGAPLSSADQLALRNENSQLNRAAVTNSSLKQRYLDLYNPNSFASMLIDHAPSTSDAGALMSVAGSTFSSSVNSIFNSIFAGARADTAGYDYGVPKYGFSPAERDNPEFDNPYDNAAVIEQPGVLDQLNQKYGKPCFGMTITTDDSGVHVDTEAMGSDDVNMFKVAKKDECQPSKNNDPLFLRYRIYLADAVTAEGLDCYEGSGQSDQSCGDLGLSSSSAPSTEQPSSAVSGDAKHLADLILNNKNIDLTCLSASVKQDVESAAQGKPGTAGAMTSSVILNLIATVGQSHKLCVTAIQSGGQGHTSGSYHYSGDAVDFGNLDGTRLTGRDSASVTILNQAGSMLPSGTGVGQSQCGSTPTLPKGWTSFTDTCNHLHIQVPRGTK
jgi:hypothetical protein